MSAQFGAFFSRAWLAHFLHCSLLLLLSFFTACKTEEGSGVADGSSEQECRGVLNCGAGGGLPGNGDGYTGFIRGLDRPFRIRGMGVESFSSAGKGSIITGSTTDRPSATEELNNEPNKFAISGVVIPQTALPGSTPSKNIYFMTILKEADQFYSSEATGIQKIEGDQFVAGRALQSSGDEPTGLLAVFDAIGAQKSPAVRLGFPVSAVGAQSSSSYEFSLAGDACADPDSVEPGAASCGPVILQYSKPAGRFIPGGGNVIVPLTRDRTKLKIKTIGVGNVTAVAGSLDDHPFVTVFTKISTIPSGIAAVGAAPSPSPRPGENGGAPDTQFSPNGTKVFSDLTGEVVTVQVLSKQWPQGDYDIILGANLDRGRGYIAVLKSDGTIFRSHILEETGKTITIAASDALYGNNRIYYYSQTESIGAFFYPLKIFITNAIASSFRRVKYATVGTGDLSPWPPPTLKAGFMPSVPLNGFEKSALGVVSGITRLNLFSTSSNTGTITSNNPGDLASISLGSPDSSGEASVLTVTKTGDGTGTVMGSPFNCSASSSECSMTFPYGTEIRLEATPSIEGDGSTFAGWDGLCEGLETSCHIPLYGPTSVVAKFNAVKKYKLSVLVTKEGNGAGYVMASGIDCGTSGSARIDCSENYRAGTTVGLSAMTLNGSRFAGWEGACSGTSSCLLANISQDATVTAKFTSP